jgi:hypothetical protein
MMKIYTRVIFMALLAISNGCATIFPPAVNIGDTEMELIAKRGQPIHRYQDGNDRLLEFSHGYWGQRTYMARIAPDGKVTSFEQVLTVQKFASIKVNVANKTDVLHTIGAPADTSYLSLRDLEVWSYPYKEQDVWNSIMHVHFDRSGIVRQMLNGPDPRYDPDRRFPFGLSPM